MSDRKRFPLSCLRICIDQAQDGEIRGSFYSPMDREKHVANGFEEFMLKAEQIFNDHDYPQAFLVGRSFQDKAKDETLYQGKPLAARSDVEMDAFVGLVATYDVIVESRRKASWQGYVRDVDGQTLGEFNGILELAEIINSYMK